MKIEVHWGEMIDDAKFNLKGKDIKSIVQELNARDEWGKFDGSLGYKFNDTSKGIVTKVKLLPRYKITMPNWPAYRNQPQSVKDNWDNMYKALKTHENEHKQIMLTGLKNVQDYLGTLSKIKNDEFKIQIEDKIKEIKKKQDKFDVSTNHGADRGVELDIPSEEK
ncbi:MAG: DUF922 domain-containing protein [candidate division Zixibacteria bacterium]